jgi:dTDP-glucose 4,6-dehydratase/UDP-glucose 4-epimerase
LNILIIGSKGFIGSHCVKFFSRNHNVWECDVAIDYVSKNYFLVDTTNADYNEIFQIQEFDVCINCSGASSVPDSIKKPQRDFILNVVNVHKQLDSIRRFNSSCKYINLSSAAVYGNPENLPISEFHILNPISPYGVHKKMSEDICKLFYEQFSIGTCSLRIFSAYGDGLKKQLFWDIYNKSISNDKIKLFGTGNESRDFVHISDLTEAISCIINNGKFNSEIINVASGLEYKIKDVVNIFFSFLNNEKCEFLGTKRKGDPSNWKADINKLKSYGFQPKIDIKTGLNRYVKWLQTKKLD